MKNHNFRFAFVLPILCVFQLQHHTFPVKKTDRIEVYMLPFTPSSFVQRHHAPLRMFVHIQIQNTVRRCEFVLGRCAESPITSLVPLCSLPRHCSNSILCGPAASCTVAQSARHALCNHLPSRLAHHLTDSVFDESYRLREPCCQSLIRILPLKAYVLVVWCVSRSPSFLIPTTGHARYLCETSEV